VPESEKGGVSPGPSAGVIGLGDIGRGLASSLMGAGVPVAVCDVREEATAPFREGAHVAATPSALVARSDVVLVAVFNDEQVRAVLQGPDGVFAGAAPGTAVVIVSTIPTTTVLEMRGEGPARGVAVVDCGVSGGPDAAASCDLVCMIGGGSAEDVPPDVPDDRAALAHGHRCGAARGHAGRGGRGPQGPDDDPRPRWLRPASVGSGPGKGGRS